MDGYTLQYVDNGEGGIELRYVPTATAPPPIDPNSVDSVLASIGLTPDQYWANQQTKNQGGGFGELARDTLSQPAFTIPAAFLTAAAAGAFGEGGIAGLADAVQPGVFGALDGAGAVGSGSLDATGGALDSITGSAVTPLPATQVAGYSATAPAEGALDHATGSLLEPGLQSTGAITYPVAPQAAMTGYPIPAAASGALAGTATGGSGAAPTAAPAAPTGAGALQNAAAVGSIGVAGATLAGGGPSGGALPSSAPDTGGALSGFDINNPSTWGSGQQSPEWMTGNTNGAIPGFDINNPSTWGGGTQPQNPSDPSVFQTIASMGKSAATAAGLLNADGTPNYSNITKGLAAGGILAGIMEAQKPKTSSSTVTYPDWYNAGAKSAVSIADKAATTPFARYTPTDASVSPYMNPYLRGALDPAIADINRSYDRIQTGNDAKAAMKGAFGTDRADVEKSLNDEARYRAVGALSGSTYANAYDKAQTLDYGESKAARDYPKTLIDNYSGALRGSGDAGKTTTTTAAAPSLVGQVAGGLGTYNALDKLGALS